MMIFFTLFQEKKKKKNGLNVGTNCSLILSQMVTQTRRRILNDSIQSNHNYCKKKKKSNACPTDERAKESFVHVENKHSLTSGGSE